MPYVVCLVRTSGWKVEGEPAVWLLQETRQRWPGLGLPAQLLLQWQPAPIVKRSGSEVNSSHAEVALVVLGDLVIGRVRFLWQGLQLLATLLLLGLRRVLWRGSLFLLELGLQLKLRRAVLNCDILQGHVQIVEVEVRVVLLAEPVGVTAVAGLDLVLGLQDDLGISFNDALSELQDTSLFPADQIELLGLKQRLTAPRISVDNVISHPHLLEVDLRHGPVFRVDRWELVPIETALMRLGHLDIGSLHLQVKVDEAPRLLQLCRRQEGARSHRIEVSRAHDA